MSYSNPTNMSTGKYIENTIRIDAPQSEVWDALINPEKTKIYMFGCVAQSSWQVGDALLWNGNYEGNEMTFVKGFIISIDPGKRLEYSTFDPNSTLEDIPENYLNVVYVLESIDTHTTQFTVTQGDYSSVADGERRYQESYNDGLGWSPILEAIKALCEAKPVNQ